MIKPFYQGKLDTFCAIYAVLNALRLLCGIRTLKARDILNTCLLSLGVKPAEFTAFLNQDTDYVAFVDHLLAELEYPWHIKIQKPFQDNAVIDGQEFWSICRNWMGSENAVQSRKTMVFRFLRYLVPDKAPGNRHWTTADYISEDILHLFDSSHEAEAILNIRRDGFVISEKDVCQERLLLIPPQSVRFISLCA